MPKSGSTYLATLLSLATGYPQHPLVFAYERNEQDLDLAALLRSLGRPTVTQQHVRATGPNLALIDAFDLRTVVLVRNLFDVVLSLHDHLVGEGLGIPCGFFSEEFLRLDRPARLDMVIDLALPWYFAFYASWADVRARGGRPTHWLTYEGLTADPAGALRGCLDFCGLPASDGAVAAAVAQARSRPTRHNKGVAGRGDADLTVAQKDRIRRLAAYYPSVDFTPVGLPAPAAARSAA
jgi:hypothetical protein